MTRDTMKTRWLSLRLGRPTTRQNRNTTLTIILTSNPEPHTSSEPNPKHKSNPNSNPKSLTQTSCTPVRRRSHFETSPGVIQPQDTVQDYGEGVWEWEWEGRKASGVHYDRVRYRTGEGRQTGGRGRKRGRGGWYTCKLLVMQGEHS